MLAMSSVMTKLESAVFANEEVKRRTPAIGTTPRPT
jgi:hypothetical protein